jgi:hypothetical protein
VPIFCIFYGISAWAFSTRTCMLDRAVAWPQDRARPASSAGLPTLARNSTPIGWLASAGTAFSWPLAARAQQSERIPKIGVLWPGASPPAPPRMESFRKGLRKLGYIEGQNVAIELRCGPARATTAGVHPFTDKQIELVSEKKVLHFERGAATGTGC